MQEDALRWDKRYKQGFMPQTSSEILHSHKTLLESYITKGRTNVLDIACGNGRNAKFLASLGFKVLGIDISQIALQSLKNIDNIYTQCVDLDYYTIAKEHYDVIINFYYLNRKLLRDIKKGLKYGGIVIFETFCNVPKTFDTQIFYEMPHTRSLKVNELKKTFRGYTILYNHYKCIFRESKPYIAQIFIAQKPIR